MPRYVPGANWDQPINQWDQGLQWDVNTGPSLGDVTPYTKLITSEHCDKPKFMCMVAGVTQALADIIAATAQLPSLFDLDNAIGAQLDIDGLWIGRNRFVDIPYSTYFTLDAEGLGLDEGIWWEPFNPEDSVVTLPDDAYRTLLRAKIAANQWDGTIPDAYAAWNILFASEGITVLIQDNGDMSMDVAILTPSAINAITLALFIGGYLDLKPDGVRINDYFTPSIPDTPYFGLDVENSSISGLDVGAWGTLTPGS